MIQAGKSNLVFDFPFQNSRLWRTSRPKNNNIMQEEKKKKCVANTSPRDPGAKETPTQPASTVRTFGTIQSVPMSSHLPSYVRSTEYFRTVIRSQMPSIGSAMAPSINGACDKQPNTSKGGGGPLPMQRRTLVRRGGAAKLQHHSVSTRLAALHAFLPSVTVLPPSVRPTDPPRAATKRADDGCSATAPPFRLLPRRWRRMIHNGDGQSAHRSSIDCDREDCVWPRPRPDDGKKQRSASRLRFSGVEREKEMRQKIKRCRGCRGCLLVR